MRDYSDDLRERVVRACDEKRGTRKEVAELFNVSTAWIRRLLQRRRETGDFSARRRGGGAPAKFTGKKLDQLKVWVGQQPDVTLQELLDRSGVEASIMAVHRALERLGCQRKKSRCMPVSKNDPT
jgi:transposase